MTIKELVSDSEALFKSAVTNACSRKEVSDNLHKLLGVLAVKAECVTDNDTEDFISRIDECRAMLEKGAFNNADGVVAFVESLSKVTCYDWEKDEFEKWKKESEDFDRKTDEEDVLKAYNHFLSLREAFKNTYGEYPHIGEE